MIRSLHVSTLIALSALGSVGVLGCAEDSTSSPMPSEPAVQKGNALVRVVHASSDAPSVDIYAKGSAAPIIAGLAYGKSTGYLELPEGTYGLELRAAGAAADSPPAFEVPALSVQAEKSYTVVAAGSLASSETSSKFRVLPYEEGFGMAESGTSRVRIIHASPDAPTVDLDVGNDDPSKAELEGLERFAETGAQGVELPAGKALQLGIAAGGATVTAFTTPALPDRGELFVIATGSVMQSPRSESSFSLLAVMPDGSTGWIKQNPFVYAVHASPNAPAVDIYAGDAEVYDNVPFGALGRIQVPPGAYALDFYPGQAGATPRPGSEPAISVQTPALESGHTYVTIAAGLLGGMGEKGFRLFDLQEAFTSPAEGEARVRVMHLSPDAPAVDIGTVSMPGQLDMSPLIQNASYGAETGAEGLALPAASLTLGVAATGSSATVAEFDVSLPSQGRLLVIAAGLLAPDAGQPGFQLLVVNSSSESILAPWTIGSASPNMMQ